MGAPRLDELLPDEAVVKLFKTAATWTDIRGNEFDRAIVSLASYFR